MTGASVAGWGEDCRSPSSGRIWVGVGGGSVETGVGIGIVGVDTGAVDWQAENKPANIKITVIIRLKFLIIFICITILTPKYCITNTAEELLPIRLFCN